MKKTLMNKSFLVLTAALALAGCRQNPFPTDGVITEKLIEPKLVYPAYVISAEDTYSCVEGLLCEFAVQAVVPTPGKAKLEAVGLPDGAEFDPLLGKFSWKPGFDVVDPSKGDGSVATQKVEFRLSSSLDRSTMISKTVILQVKNSPRDWTVTADATKEMTEGFNVSQTVTIGSLDYPNGPFQLFIEGAPTGVQVSQSSGKPSEFTVSYTPAFSLVTSKNKDGEYYRDGGYRYYKDLAIVLVAMDPSSGIAKRKAVTWTVIDSRKKPMFSGPTAIQARESAVFTLRADDLNSEDFPTLELVGGVPFGKMERSAVQAPGGGPGDFPSTWVTFDWHDVPASAAGKKVTLNFRSCIEGPYRSDVCENYSVTTEFTFKVAPAPTIDRAKWPMEKTIYLKSGDHLSFNLPIFDAEDASKDVAVEIFPESARGEVTWKSGTLTIRPRTEGSHQFKLVATSLAGQTQSESFVMDILSMDWSSVVLFASDLNRPEIMTILKAVPTASVVHPLFQKDVRTYEKREAIFITTEMIQTLGSRADWKWIDEKLTAIPNLWVSSPLLAELIKYSAYLNTLMIGNGLKVPGRLSKYSNGEPLKSFSIALDPTSDLEKPSKRVTLDGTLTSESTDPALISLDSASKCEKVMSLQGEVASFLFGVSCEKMTPGRLVVFGTEWADFRFDVSEADLKAKWISKLLTNGGVRQ